MVFKWELLDSKTFWTFSFWQWSRAKRRGERYEECPAVEVHIPTIHSTLDWLKEPALCLGPDRETLFHGIYPFSNISTQKASNSSWGSSENNGVYLSIIIKHVKNYYNWAFILKTCNNEQVTNCGAWWLSGRFGASRPKDRRFESH